MNINAASPWAPVSWRHHENLRHVALDLFFARHRSHKIVTSFLTETYTTKTIYLRAFNSQHNMVDSSSSYLSEKTQRTPGNVTIELRQHTG